MRLPFLLFLLASSLAAQSVTIDAPVFTGAGLNDASSGGRFSRLPTNAAYTVTIDATGTPDTFKWQKDGGSFTTGVAMTGADQTLSDGVTIRFLATTGHTLADQWVVNASARGSLAGVNTIQAGSGAVTRSAEDAARDSVTVSSFIPVIALPTADISAYVARGISAASQAGRELRFPGRAQPYLLCNVTMTGANVSLAGDGMGASLVQRHPSCLQAVTDMFDITSGSISVRGIGFDQLTDGSTFGKSILNINNASSVDVTSSSFSHAQAVAIQLNDSDHVRIQGNKFKENWWFGISAASSSPTSAPVYHYDYAITGNTFENTPIGIGLNFFLSRITITGNVLDKSTIDLVQTPHADATITGNTIVGIPAYGCLSACYAPPGYDGIFLEGASDVEIGNNFIKTVGSAGVRCQGSTLTIPYPSGTTLELPCSRLTIHDNHIDGAAASYPIIVVGSSNGGSPVAGREIKLSNNWITNSLTCPNLTGDSATPLDDVIETGDRCENSTNGGFFWTNVTHGVFAGNFGHNIGSASSGSYPGLIIDGTASQNIDVFNNVMRNDGAYSMSYCYEDNTLNGGYPSQVRHWHNAWGGCGLAWAPVPAIPTLGAWSRGDTVESFGAAGAGNTGAGAETTGWVNVTAGSPGTWVTLANLPDTNGYYKIVDPATPAHLVQIGVNHSSGNAEIGSGQPVAVVSTDLYFININTATTLFHIDGAGGIHTTGGAVGITGATCSHWTNGLCDTP